MHLKAERCSQEKNVAGVGLMGNLWYMLKAKLARLGAILWQALSWWDVLICLLDSVSLNLWGDEGQAAGAAQQQKNPCDGRGVLSCKKGTVLGQTMVKVCGLTDARSKATSLLRDLYAKHSSISASLKDSEQWKGFDGTYCTPNSILNSTCMLISPCSGNSPLTLRSCGTPEALQMRPGSWG